MTKAFIYPCRATFEHMPFKGHRTQAEVIESENRHAILNSLARNGRRKGKAA